MLLRLYKMEIDWPGLHRRGPQGASAVFGPRKGAGAAVVAQLDAKLRH